MSQYFEDCRTGIACQRGDVDGATQLIGRWYQDEPGAERIGRAARAAAAAYSADAFERALAGHVNAFIAKEASRDRG